MYRVLIADDEPWAAYGLKNLLPWNEYGFEVVQLAHDGLSALADVERLHPDLLLSDIRMPGMDGLSLVQAVHAASPETAIILVTGHSEFAYAQQAVRLGVFDYLVKQVKKSELISALERVRKHLDSRSDEPDWDGYFSLFADDHQRTVAQCLAEIQPCTTWSRCFFATCIYTENLDTPILSKIQLRNGQPVLRFRTGVQKEALLFLFAQDDDTPLATLAELSLPVSTSIGYSDTVTPQGGFFALWQQSDIAAVTAFTHGIHTPVPYTTEESDAVDALVQAYARALRVGDLSTVKEQIHQAGSMCASLQADAIARLYNRMSSVGQEMQYGNDENLRPIQYTHLSTASGTAQALFADLEKCILSQPENRTVSHSQIQQILDFVDDNYTLDLRITDLEKQFFLSANYLSILIKKETGYTFTDLIILKRLEMAKKLLLETDMPIQDVMEMVGYKEYSYFIKLFKRNTGVTPYQFRRRTLSKDE